MGARRRGRELAVQMLYQWEVGGESTARVLEASAELTGAGEEARRFARRLFEGVSGQRNRIDAMVAEHSDKWRLERMATVDRNILRVAVFEFLELGTPKNVTIDEAVEVAKRYASPESAAFVNGVLDALLGKLEAAPVQESE